MEITANEVKMSWLNEWWVPIVRGVFAIAFGILMLTWPGPTLLSLVFIFGVYAIADGIVALVSIFRADRRAPRWALLFEALVGIAAGVIIFTAPGPSVAALFFVIAVWAIITGLFEIASAFQIRHFIPGELFLFASGVVSVLLGVLMLSRPAAGLVALVWLVGIYALFFGVLFVMLGLHLHKLRNDELGAGEHVHYSPTPT